ncbi:MAG: cupredoxin domain-containing protein [Actinomycetes bacterium]
MALAITLAACGSSGGPSKSSGTQKQSIAGVSANVHGTHDVTGMSAFEIEADNFYFEPSVLKGTPGQHLTITIKNTSGTNHNFTVASQHVNKDLDGGKTETVSVTFPASGTISFFCEYHKASGMAGGLQAG